MSDMFSLSFDEASLKEIVAFASFDVFLTGEMAIAMQSAGDLLASAAVAKTWQVFANPTGALASTIVPVLDSPFEVQVGVGSPYGMRRERGFMGMYDSLGRGPFDDPARPYLEPALQENEQQVLQLVDQAVIAALERMGAHF